MKKIVLLSILSLFLFASCDKDEELDGTMAGSYQGLIASIITHGEYTISGSRCANLDIASGSAENEIIFKGYYGAEILAIIDGDKFTIPSQEVSFEGIAYTITGSGFKTKGGCYFSAAAAFYVDGDLWVKTESGNIYRQ